MNPQPAVQARMKSLLRTILPRRARAHRILWGPLRGMQIVTSWHDYPAAILGTTELALIRWFAANVRQGETWLDVGAHYGYTALALCRYVGSAGRVFAFEPVITTAAYLDATRQSNQLRQLTVVPIALGRDDQFRVTTSSLDRGMATHVEMPHVVTNIYSMSLDQLWPGIKAEQPRINGIKIDVQGMEEETVCGMLGVLRRWRPKLIIEFHSGVNRLRIVNDLVGVGYQSTPLAVESAEADPSSFDYKNDCSYVFVPEKGS